MQGRAPPHTPARTLTCGRIRYIHAGPLFVKVNAVLRNKGKTEGNNYSNVIHAIISGI